MCFVTYWSLPVQIEREVLLGFSSAHLPCAQKAAMSDGVLLLCMVNCRLASPLNSLQIVHNEDNWDNLVKEILSHYLWRLVEGLTCEHESVLAVGCSDKGKFGIMVLCDYTLDLFSRFYCLLIPQQEMLIPLVDSAVIQWHQ